MSGPPRNETLKTSLSDSLAVGGSYENYSKSAHLQGHEAVLEIVDLPTRYPFSAEIEITHFLSCGGFSCYVASVNFRPLLPTVLEKYMFILSNKKGKRSCLHSYR